MTNEDPLNTAEVVSRIEKRIKTALSALNDATELLAELKPESKQKEARKADESGAPLYVYAYKVPIPKNMQVQPRHIEYAKQFGIDETGVHKLFNGDLEKDSFVQYYRKKGTKWIDWDLVFMKWIRTSKGNNYGGNKNQQTQRPTRFDAIRNGKS